MAGEPIRVDLYRSRCSQTDRHLPRRQERAALADLVLPVPSQALPPYFNFVFYKRSNGEPYSLYSPNRDGPARLVATLEAMNDQKRSLDILRKSLGNEVATTALTLIPGEPVDLGRLPAEHVLGHAAQRNRGICPTIP